MGQDVALGAGAAVAIEHVGQEIVGAGEEAALQQPPHPIDVGGEGLQQGREVGRIPLAGHEALAEADVAGGEHAVQEAEVADDQAGVGPRLRANDRQVAA